MSKRFGRPKGPTKEDIEREAEREVARLRQQTGATPPGPEAGATPHGGGVGGPGLGGSGGGLRTPLDDIAESARGRSAGRGESPSPVDPGYGPMASGPVGPGGYGVGPFGGGGPFVGGGPAARGGIGGRPPSIEVPEFEDPDDESASITELALRDHAARYGTNPEDLVIRSDPAMAEAMRDEAMRRFMDRQQARQTQATVTKLDPSQTVLGRLAARRKAKEEGREPEPEPEPTGGGLLGRLGQVEDEEEGLSPLERRARVAARRREEMQHSSAQVFAMPTAGPEETGSPELAAMAARLSAQAKPRRGASAEAVDAGPPPAPAAPRKAAARKAPVKKAAARSRAAAKKVPARSTVAAKKSAVRKAPARAATKKAPTRAATKATKATRATKAGKATKGAGRQSRSTTTTTRARAKKRG